MLNSTYRYCRTKKGRLKLVPKETKIARFIYNKYFDG